jgi:anthranilate synthase component 1
MVTPSVEAYTEAAEAGRRPALRRRIPADLETPVSAFLKLQPVGATLLLESVERGIQVGRYSFIGLDSGRSVRLAEGTVEVQANGATTTEPMDPSAPFAAVRRQLADYADVDGDGLPGPFCGAVGYIGYDMVRTFEQLGAAPPDDRGFPDYQLVFPETVAVFDHVASSIELVTLPPLSDDPQAAWAAAAERLDQLYVALTGPLPAAMGTSGYPASAEPTSSVTQEEFESGVRQAKEHILAGDAFQIVLSQRLEGVTESPPFQIYRALRILNPSPYLFFMDLGELQLVGSSPEMLVKLSGRRAEVCPIAGTRPRGADPVEDRRLAEELIACEKERAEHVMLVDLGRNDLGRVCEVGTVAPDSLLEIEKYSHVQHIVSRVSGTLEEGLDQLDLLRATFPAGTVTGAPKIRAMQLIDEIERQRRGPYAGAVGYLGRQGDMDLCIAIRTLIVHGDRYIAQAGAGIVADSDPASEYHETLSKVGALIQAVRNAEEGLL